MLKTDYKDDMFTGARKYALVANEDRTTSLVDMTEYTQEGDQFGANDINDTNKVINALLTPRQVTLPAAGWSAEAPYTQTVPVEGMTEMDSPIPGIQYPNDMDEATKKAIDKSAGMLTKLVTANGGLMAECKFKKPAVDIPLVLKGV